MILEKIRKMRDQTFFGDHQDFGKNKKIKRSN